MTGPEKTPARLDLTGCLNPRGVAVVGVSSNASRIGGQALRLLTDFGYAGHIYPVNPKYRDVKGISCYPDLASVPQPCDLALIALSAAHVVPAIEQCGTAGIPYALVLAGGFGEVGADGAALQCKLAEAARKAGVRLVGPNCLGLMNLKDGARIGFGGTMQLKMLKPGPLAMVTQSGGFGFGVVAMACQFGLGFNYVISTGNEVDLTALDWIADLIERPDVQIVVAFLEGIKDGRQLLRIGARAIELGKPILVWKVGNTEIGRQAATSHTARMTAGYELFRAAFRCGGFVEIRDVDDLIDIAKAFGIGKLPAGNRVAVLTLSGGAGVLLADRCIEHGLQLPALTDATATRLRKILVSFASAANPIDATAHGYNDNFASYSSAIREVLADPNIDQVIARVPRGSAAGPWSEGLVETLRHTNKPLVLNWPTAPDDNGHVREYLERNNIPCILAPGRSVRALAALTEFAQKQRDFERTRTRTAARAAPPQAIEFPAQSGALGEHQSKAVLQRYGIPAVGELLMTPSEVEALTALPLAFPLAVKVESADLPHKTEVGAVRLNVPDLAALKQAAREVVAAAKGHRPDARIAGVLVQEMTAGLEVIVGAVNDPYFGPVVAFGLGGVFTELLQDVTHRFAPFDAEAAREMISEIKGAKLLKGYRGKPMLDVGALAEVLARVSLLVADHADRIAEIDINPLFVREAGRGVAAADALIILKQG